METRLQPRASLALLVGVLLLTSCAGNDAADVDSASSAVVKIGDRLITRADYHRFERQARAAGSGRRELRGGVRAPVLIDLIEAEWVRREAAAEGVKVPPGIAAIEEGPSLLAARRARALEDEPLPPGAVASWYRRHRDDFARPDQRNWRAVVSDTMPKARRAKRALAGGASWSAVARRFGAPGLEAPTRFTGAKDGIDPALRQPIFAAGAGDLVGPVVTRSGIFVVGIDKAFSARQLSLKESRELIVPLLVLRRLWRGAVDYWEQVRVSARRQTVCLTDVRVPLCRNGSAGAFDRDGTRFPPPDLRPSLSPPQG